MQFSAYTKDDFITKPKIGSEVIGRLRDFDITQETLKGRTIYRLYHGDENIAEFIAEPVSRLPKTTSSCLEIGGARILPQYRGKALAKAFYSWLLQSVDFLQADELQSRAGMGLWAQMLDDPAFSIYVYDAKRDEGKRVGSLEDFVKAYRRDELRLYAGLRGRLSPLDQWREPRSAMRRLLDIVR